MQLSLIFLLPIVAFVSGTSAADCYSQGGSNRCVDINSLWQFRQFYCTQEWQGNGGSKRYNANNGFGSLFLRSGSFNSQQQCWDSTENIIKACFGHKDGGTWDGSMMQMNINFCA
ncbi:hypothetical protein BDZ94DRAFT_1162754 [Collybia nuda]|uniref:Uncharacterized protein n=1 Tax=Collybia nuda TaxID=64659 RepID=A0A9P5Y931_9AGAR|nr:hypothetical protein BDZ94DRAFT_1162754 [Collybia nuda]